MLCRLGLELARRRDEWHQREVDEECIVATDFLAKLTDRLEERQRFDVAHRAADFGDYHIVPRRGPAKRPLISPSVMCRTPAPCQPRYSPRRFLADHRSDKYASRVMLFCCVEVRRSMNRS